MAIRLLRNINNVGVANDVVSLNAALEARLVSANNAVYVSGPDIGDSGVPVMGKTDPVTGRSEFSAGKSKIHVALRGDESRVFQSGQPFGITRPVVKQGAMFSDFSGTRCTAVSAANTTLSNDYTGYDGSNIAQPVQSITGLPSMLKLTVASDTAQQFQITNANLGSVDTAGVVGFWVYLDTTTKVSGALPSLGIDFFTSTNWQAGSTRASFNSNQLRPGWNFLIYRQIKAIGDMPASEQHFLGLTASKSGTGSNGDIRTSPLRYINIDVQNVNGCVLYFDSLWTGFETKAQFVIGCDQATTDTATYALPKFEQHGWIGYFATPYRVWSSGSKIVSNWDLTSLASNIASANSLYAAGWDCVNHTANHLANGTLTAPGEIRYEIEAANAWYRGLGFDRGLEFYASPQSSTSVLSERIISECGIKLQRHARRSNVAVTQFGVDNINHVGAIDMSSSTAGYQKASLIKAWVDNIIAYGATGFPFWHGITTLGDTGSGEDLTGNDLNMTLSAFNIAMGYIKSKEDAGLCRVCDGVTGFYYGVGR